MSIFNTKEKNVAFVTLFFLTFYIYTTMCDTFTGYYYYIFFLSHTNLKKSVTYVTFRENPLFTRGYPVTYFFCKN